MPGLTHPREDAGPTYRGPLATFFRHDLRVLPCETCGAPLEGATSGGRVECRYCHDEQELTPREDAPLIIGPRLPEPERLEVLRRQDAVVLPRPASLRDLLLGDWLVPWTVPRALARWQLARREHGSRRDPAAAEELFALTEALTQHYERRSQWLEARALGEGALDELGEPRQRQELRAFLARAAALTGDVGAAEAWLAGCDPAAASLESDGAFRLARACIDSVRGDFGRVLDVLGKDVTDVPLPNALDPAAALLRANAWERLGRVDRAAELLVHLAEHGGPVFHLKARELAERHPELGLCAASAPLAEPRIAALWQARATTVKGPWGCFVVGGVLAVLFTVVAFVGVLALSLGFADASGFGVVESLAAGGSIALFVLTFVSMMGTIFGLLGALEIKKARADRELLRNGRLVPGVVVQRMATGNATMGVAEVAVRVLILDGSMAYLASTETYMPNPDAPAYARGAPVALRLDRDDPHAFTLVQ